MIATTPNASRLWGTAIRLHAAALDRKQAARRAFLASDGADLDAAWTLHLARQHAARCYATAARLAARTLNPSKDSTP
jgi:hypothetical protein